MVFATTTGTPGCHPGLTFHPSKTKSINVGFGVSLPVTDDRDFDYAVNAMTIFHF